MDFDAGVVIQGEILENLLNDGVPMLPTQWIETDENDHLRRPGVGHEAVTKSRLVACGQYENREGLRTDSPTASVEALNLICSFAACKKLKIKIADIKNAYFNADPIDRLLLLKSPRGGLPGYWKFEKMQLQQTIRITVLRMQEGDFIRNSENVRKSKDSTKVDKCYICTLITWKGELYSC